MYPFMRSIEGCLAIVEPIGTCMPYLVLSGRLLNRSFTDSSCFIEFSNRRIVCVHSFFPWKTNLLKHMSLFVARSPKWHSPLPMISIDWLHCHVCLVKLLSFWDSSRNTFCFGEKSAVLRKKKNERKSLKICSCLFIRRPQVYRFQDHSHFNKSLVMASILPWTASSSLADQNAWYLLLNSKTNTRWSCFMTFIMTSFSCRLRLHVMWRRVKDDMHWRWWPGGVQRMLHGVPCWTCEEQWCHCYSRSCCWSGQEHYSTALKLRAMLPEENVFG